MLLTFFSCGNGEGSYTSYDIKNATGRDVKLALSNFPVPTTVGRADKVFSIKNGEVEKFGQENGSINHPFSPHIDSAWIVFDDTTKVLYLPGDGKPRNILDINSYTGGAQGKRGKDKDLFIFTYTITEEDYLNAQN